MNILIVDDDYNKINNITVDLLKQDPSNKVRYTTDYEQAVTFIMDNKEYIDLIVLDWCFPPNSWARSKYAMGRQVINNMKLSNIDIKTIICSSDVINIDKNEYPFVLGAITYCEGLDVGKYIYSYLDIGEEKEEEYIGQPKVLKKVKEDIGYRRKKSSTPWWIK